ncbi:MAG: DUF1559 domain-containing protein [Planctomycetaceae bacterium]
MRGSISASPMKNRSGFTLIELLVVISIIAVLMSLILPAIQSARMTARRTQCLNRVRNLSIGLASYTSRSAKAQLPPYGTWGDYREDTTASPWKNTSNPAQLKSWVVDVLAYIDRADIADRWDIDRKHDSPFVQNNASNLQLIKEYNMAVLTCPDDPTAAGIPGALSYVVNAGYASIRFKSSSKVGHEALAGSWGAARQQSDIELLIDWDGDGKTAGQHDDPEDIVINHQSGLMWPETLNRQGIVGKPTRLPNHSHTMNTIYDGTTNTLMVTENVNAGGSQHWGDPDPRYTTFVYPIDHTGGGLSPTEFYKTAPLDPNVPDGVINGALAGPEGERPFPNSNHPGGVNVGFCDGSARFLNEDISLAVYAQLITPGGTRLSQFVSAQPTMGQGGF